MISVVIPCYKVKKHILKVISEIGAEVESIYVVDDCCPEKSGNYVKEFCTDSRVRILNNEVNKGVGGAVITGYKQAIIDGATIIVKLDGDGQMNPNEIPKLIKPILNGEADYCKGNRFFDLEKLMKMPKIRLFGNSILSLVNKIVSGYWNIVDPTNGYTAIHINVLEMLPLSKIDNRYFFESDMLFRLSIIRAVVKDIAMPVNYADEKSNLNIGKVLFEFPFKYTNRFFKRIIYNYLLRDFNAGSLQIIGGLFLTLIGSSFGIYHWILSNQTKIVATTGTVMIAAVLFILGFQLLLSGLNYDVQNTPHSPIHKR